MHTVSASTVVAIGKGTLVSGNATTPFASKYRVSRHAFLYAWDEFAEVLKDRSELTLYAISFEIESFSPQLLQNFCCHVGSRATSEYSDEEAQFNPELQKVFCHSIQVTQTGWKQLAFDRPYVLRSGANLEVELSFENSSFSENTHVYCHEVEGGQNRTICGYGDRLSLEDMPAMGAVSTRPNVLLHFH